MTLFLKLVEYFELFSSLEWYFEKQTIPAVAEPFEICFNSCLVCSKHSLKYLSEKMNVRFKFCSLDEAAT